MNNTFYIQEAFSRLKLLDEDAFDFSKDAGIEDKLTSFVADDIDYEEEPIVDVEAETDSDLQDSYVGKVILECNCCHTRVYKDEDDVVIDEEEGSANMDEPCPVCNGEFGYTVIGKIEPFNADADPAEAEDDEPLEVDLTDEKDSEGEVEEEPAEEEEPEEDEDEDEDDDEKVESYRNLIKGKKINEAKDETNKDDVCPKCGKNPCICEKCDEDLNEDIKDFSLADSVDIVDYLIDTKGDLNSLVGKTVCIPKEGVYGYLSDFEEDEEIPDFDKLGFKTKGDQVIVPAGTMAKVVDAESGYDPVIYLEINGEEIPWAVGYTNHGDMLLLNESTKSRKGKRINEEELAHGNDQIGVRDDTSVDDDQSLEDDQTELYKAAFEKRDAINESHKKLANINRKIKSISEALDDVVVNTDDGSVEVSKEGQKVVVDFSGGGEGEMPESDPMAGEMIAPLGDEDIAGIEDNVPEDEMGGEEMPMDDVGTEGDHVGDEGEPMGGEEMPAEGGEEPAGEEGEMPMGDEEEEGPPMESLETNNDGKLFLEAFDNEGFEKMADVFMHRVYENVDSYKVNRVGQNDKNGSVIVEGVINFRSGKSAPTTFTFDSFSESKTGKVVLEGINTTFSKTRAFRMRGSLTNKQYIPESFVYNFNTTALNESNESEVVKVQGRVKR